MQRYKYILLFSCLIFQAVSFSTRSNPELPTVETESYQVFDDMQLEGIVNYNAFEEAYIGYKTITDRKKDLITLIDFTKPSTEERLYVLDIKEKRLLFSSYVSHGRNSGDNYATSFSNEMNSYQSSLGFFVTENTYMGKNGYSLVLNGLEKGINDRAKERAIVIHGAAYSNPSVVSSMGRLGRSHGCPALPVKMNGPIINTIKDGSVVFIYANNDDYAKRSAFLSQKKMVALNN